MKRILIGMIMVLAAGSWVTVIVIYGDSAAGT